MDRFYYFYYHMVKWFVISYFTIYKWCNQLELLSMIQIKNIYDIIFAFQMSLQKLFNYSNTQQWLYISERNECEINVSKVFESSK